MNAVPDGKGEVRMNAAPDGNGLTQTPCEICISCFYDAQNLTLTNISMHFLVRAHGDAAMFHLALQSDDDARDIFGLVQSTGGATQPVEAPVSRVGTVRQHLLGRSHMEA